MLADPLPYLFFFIMLWVPYIIFLFFFNDTATTEIYTLSLHDALPISKLPKIAAPTPFIGLQDDLDCFKRSEEHTSELQSPDHLVCRLLLEKKKQETAKNSLPLHPAPSKTSHLTPTPDTVLPAPPMTHP